MDHPLTLTPEMLESILSAVTDTTPHLANGVYAPGTVTDTDVKDVNNHLANHAVVGPVMVIDIAPNAGVMYPSSLGAAINHHNNNLEDLAEETKKMREGFTVGLTQIIGELQTLTTTIRGSDSTYVLGEIRDAIRSLSDANILAQPLATDPNQLDQAADRVLQLLDRRPDLKAAVQAKLG